MAKKSPSRAAAGRPGAERPSPPRRWPIALVPLAIATPLAVGWIWYANRSAVPGIAHSADQNILVVTIDTLRADALASYGGRAETPQLDRLAGEGRRFTFAHAHAVMTLPSHASIFTGQYPFEHGVRDNAGFRLHDAAVTLAEIMREKGWATGAFVGAFPVNREFGLAQGFEVYDDVGGREAPAAEFAFTERRAEEVVGRARAWIAKQQRPWLAWVHVFDPHAPYAPPEPFAARYAAEPYAGEVAYVDHALGPLLDLARQGARPTTIVVTSDHGEALGDHGEATHGVFAYEATLRVPLLLAQVGPGAPRGRAATSDALVRHVDILPTLLDLLELEARPNLPGRTLAGAGGSESDPRVSYFESMSPMLTRGWAPLSGVLADRQKYIQLPVEELYDLAADPLERRNLAEGSPDRKQELAARLARFDAGLPGAPIPETAAAAARLRSLGYAAGAAPPKTRYTAADDPKRLIELETMMLRGIELSHAGRYDEAVDTYREILRRRPTMNLAYRRLAGIQWEHGAADAAIATLREARERNGPDTEIEIRLGTFLAEAGATAEAVALLERVARANASHAEAQNALGVAYARANRPAAALAKFEEVLALNPRDAFALENIGTIHLQRGDLAAAESAFGRAVQADQGSSRAHAGLGVVAVKSGRTEAAIEHWRRAVLVDRRNFDALFNLATELVNAGRLDEARPYLQQFVRTAPRAAYGADIERLRRLLERGT